MEGQGKQLHVTALSYDLQALERSLRFLAEKRGAQARIDGERSQVVAAGLAVAVGRRVDAVRFTRCPVDARVESTRIGVKICGIGGKQGPANP